MKDDEDRDLVKSDPEDEDGALEPQDDEPLIAERIDAPLTVEDVIDGAGKVLGDVASSARRLVDQGRYRKVRITRKGKKLVPDIPVAAAAAMQAASIYGAGIARVLAVNVGAKFLFDVEIINEADKYVQAGNKALLDGDLERAIESLERAVRIDDTHAEAFLQLGVVYRLSAEPEKARPCLERAKALDDTGDHGRRATELLRAIDGE